MVPSVVAQVDDHIDAVLHRLAQTDDAAAADSQTCLLRSADGGDFVVVSMGRADIEHVTAKNRCKPVFLKGDNKNVEKTYGFSVSFFCSGCEGLCFSCVLWKAQKTDTQALGCLRVGFYLLIVA